MDATRDLRTEHGAVARMLSVLDGMGARAAAGERTDAGDLDECIGFLRVFVDRCHHTKEEQLLFPAMRAAGLTEVEPTIERLLADHEHGRKKVDRLEALGAQIREGRPNAEAEFAETATDYSALLRAHIRVEEGDCFDVADRKLDPATQARLAEGYERVEREVVGEGTHERFHALLDRLSRAYQHA